MLNLVADFAIVETNKNFGESLQSKVSYCAEDREKSSSLRELVMLYDPQTTSFQ